MDKTKLQQELEQLHAELGRTQAVDTESRQLLEQLQSDIQAVLKQSNTESHASLVERLNAAVTQFEESHPDLTLTIKQLLDNLASI